MIGDGDVFCMLLRILFCCPGQECCLLRVGALFRRLLFGYVKQGESGLRCGLLGLILDGQGDGLDEFLVGWVYNFGRAQEFCNGIGEKLANKKDKGVRLKTRNNFI